MRISDLKGFRSATTTCSIFSPPGYPPIRRIFGESGGYVTLDRMNDLFGLLAWQVVLALCAVALWLATRGRGEASRDRRGQVVAAWLLLAGAGVGVLPLLMLRGLFAGAEILLALAPPLLTFVICVRILALRIQS
jgi:hypothetical protein